MLLQVDHLSSAYGRIPALHDVSLAAPEGRIVALIGANGAGKTTLLRAISGLQPISNGRIVFRGVDLARAPAAARVRLGVVQVPEGRQVFGPLSVEDNLLLGAHTRPRDRAARLRDEVFTLFPVLRERRSAAAGALSGGEQQMLAIGRALMSEPQLLLLDEPSLGLAPMMVSFIFERVRELNARGVTILLVEQNAGLALEIADEAFVLETGRILTHGTGQALLNDPAVQSAYLGVG